MLRRAFLRRMIFAGLATWFLDLPLPRETVDPIVSRWASVSFPLDDGSLLVVMEDVTDTGLDVGDRVSRNVSGVDRVGTINGVTLWTDPLA